MAAGFSKCGAVSELLRVFLCANGSYNSPVFSIQCGTNWDCTGQGCCTGFEGDADTVYSIVGRILDCLYRFRGACDRLEAIFWFDARSSDAHKSRWAQIDITIDAGCSHGVLECWCPDDASLVRLFDPLRGEGLVRLGEKLYVDKALAECISRGGRCGEIRWVGRRRYKDDWLYVVDVCGEDYQFPAPPLTPDKVMVGRVLGADRLSPSVVLGVARRLGTSIEKVEIWIHCVRDPRKNPVGIGKTDIIIRPGKEAGRLYVEACISAYVDRVSSRESHFFLHSLLCLARVLSRAGRVQYKNAEIEYQ